MPAVLRAPRPDECAALTALNLRSKAHWGYDAAFMAACEEELTITPQDLTAREIVVLEQGGTLVATAQLETEGDTADLMKFFVDPGAMGQGHGARLFAWAVEHARATGAKAITIEADPQAAPFYERMGATNVGEAPSCSIPGRMLPLLRYDLAMQADTNT